MKVFYEGHDIFDFIKIQYGTAFHTVMIMITIILETTDI